ncbi:MAG TPA: hypothetical protein VGA04_30420 [Streptosporangiaceae bacterium]
MSGSLGRKRQEGQIGHCDPVAKVVTEHPDRFSGYGTISMNPVKIPRALAQVQRAADLGLAGLSLQPSFFGIPIDDRVLYPVYAKVGRTGPPGGAAYRHQLHGDLPDPQRPADPG